MCTIALLFAIVIIGGKVMKVIRVHKISIKTYRLLLDYGFVVIFV